MLVIALGIAAIIVLLGSATIARDAESLLDDLFLHRRAMPDEPWVEPAGRHADRRAAVIRALGDMASAPPRSHRDYASHRP